MNLGTFTHDAASNTYAGVILTLAHRVRVRIEPNPVPSRDDPSDYRVFAVTPLGTFMCGRGHECIASNFGPVILIELHDPTFRRPLMGLLYRRDDGSATLHWPAPRRSWIDVVRDWIG